MIVIEPARLKYNLLSLDLRHFTDKLIADVGLHREMRPNLFA